MRQQEQEKRAERCRRIARQLEDIGDKLRSGYTAKQDNPLHRRQRQLQDEQREFHCR